MKNIDIKNLLNLLNQYQINIIDIRSNHEYNQGHIPTSINIAKTLLQTSPEKYLNKERTYYIYCQSGSTSTTLSEYLNSKGYKIVNITGGYNNYLLRK